jgi:hypothetical protein
MKYILILILLVNGLAQFPAFPKFENFIPLEETTVYSPIDANTTYFWRADQGITLASTKISQWDDQISTFDFVQGTDGNRPTFISDSTAAYFIAANSTYMATASSPTMDTSTFSIDFYIKIFNKDTSMVFLTEYQASTTYWQLATTTTSVGQILFNARNGGTIRHNTLISAAVYTAGKRNCFTLAIDAGVSDAWYLNGDAVAHTDATNNKLNYNNTGTLRIGTFAPSLYFRGYIWAIRISNKVRTELEHEAFYAWCQETF